MVEKTQAEERLTAHLSGCFAPLSAIDGPAKGSANGPTKARAPRISVAGGTLTIARINLKGAGGFTLIELLIVAAIISILAAIALPNFLEAQVRAKISRTKADMRSIATGLEAYMLEWNTYPHSDWNGILYAGLNKLTTPVAYLSSIPAPAFGRGAGRQEVRVYEFGCGKAGAHWSGGDWYMGRVNYPNDTYIVESAGPQQTEATAGIYRTIEYPMWPENDDEGALALVYDPTNGARSRGQIFRAGGAAPPEPAVHLFYNVVSGQ